VGSTDTESEATSDTEGEAGDDGKARDAFNTDQRLASSRPRNHPYRCLPPPCRAIDKIDSVGLHGEG
jgi:hypothetical protein